jgi:hypothetical protein
MKWTPDRVAALPSKDIKQLAINAAERGGVDVVALCEAELEARKPKTFANFKMPEGVSKVVRTAVVKTIEKDINELLVNFANELLLAYDLSPQTASALSEGSKGFRIHELLSDGVSKFGAAQTVGLAAFDRFISYRLKDEAFALLCLLTNADDMDGVQYQVFGPERLLDNFIPLVELRPFPLTEIDIGIYTGGESFSTFKEAADRFRWLIDQVAKKH